MLEVNAFTGIRISLASPEQIRNWSYGEVTKPETINYRTLRPEKDGLFCERIFGPTRDWECYCGKYKRIRYKGIVCDKCGVEVARAKVRRERMGHIELASPVSHIWYLAGTPSYLSILLDIPYKKLEKVVYFASYIVTKVDEEERQKALADADEALRRRIEEIHNSRAERLAEIESLREQRLRDLQENHQRDVQKHQNAAEEAMLAARNKSEEFLNHVRDLLGEEVTHSLAFEPAQGVFIEEGATVTGDLLATVEEQLNQWLNAEQARLEAEIAKLEQDYHNKQTRFNTEAQGDVDNIDRTIAQEEEAERSRFERAKQDLAQLEYKSLLTDEQFRRLKSLFPKAFEAGIGAEAVRDLILGLDLNQEAERLREIVRGDGHREKLSTKAAAATKRLRVVENFRKSGARPEWMILTVLPVIPPDLRPMVQLDGGRFATSDLNDLYRRVINRNNRLKRLLELGAPDIIVRNEKRMLQEAVDALIDNGRRGRAVAGSGNHKLKSLSDMLKGKQGRFRQNLLGKRVDYSGRSVIVVGPHLKLHQCGLPKRMALELFKPFVMHKLVENGTANNIKAAKRLVERQRPEVWEVLEEVTSNHPVLLNRAPTLHRLGIQAFEVVLVEGSAIQIHPLVCTAFNADFDGDQMAVHVPLSLAAQAEARELMLASKNLLSPADGEPIVSPTKDMVLGCYYLMNMRPDDDPAVEHNKGRFRIFDGFEDAFMAHEAGQVSLQTPIYIRIPRNVYEATADSEFIETSVGRVPRSKIVPVLQRRPDGSYAPGKTVGVKTTIGRLIFNYALPEEIRFYNDGTARELVDKAGIRRLIGLIFRVCGRERTAEAVDRIKTLGFHYATIAGTTAAIDDIKIPEVKREILAAAEAQVRVIDDNYREGLCTDAERTQDLIKIWKKVEEDLLREVRRNLPQFGSIAMMAESGAAKGGFNQIRQLAGLRGLFANPKGQIIPLPVRSNLREGLTMLEYFMSTHGARKGLADTAIRTAESGYLTRRLIDVAQDVIIYEDDCGTFDGISISIRDCADYNIQDPTSKEARDLFQFRIVGRRAAAPVADPTTGEIIVDRNEEINDAHAERFLTLGIDDVLVRSPLTCQASRGLCCHCYGRNLAIGESIGIGEAVGIMAAQSIGEPGTQLTMRTFHTGGTAGEDITMGLPRVEEIFEARNPKDPAVLSHIAGRVSISRGEKGPIITVTPTTKVTKQVALPAGMEWVVGDGDYVEVGDLLARPVTSAEDQQEIALAPQHSLTAGLTGRVTISGDLAIIELQDTEEKERSYQVAPTVALRVQEGEMVAPGDALTEGHINPKELLDLKGVRAVQKYLVSEVQKVYRSQGVHIHDKHVETIVRQMLRRVRVTESGDTELLPNDYVDRFTFDEVNARSIAQGGDAAVAQPALLGVTKAALFSESFLARASFQETTRVLTESAISGARDRLLGLKENVIIGKLIPAGTGLKRRAELAEHQRLQTEQQALVASGVSSEFSESLPPVFPTAGADADIIEEEDDSFFSSYVANLEEEDDEG